MLAPLGGTSKGPLGAQLSAHHPILAGGTGMAPHPHSAIVGAPFLPGARLPVGSPDDLCFSTSQDFPLPSGNVGLPQCQPQCSRPGWEGDFHPPPPLPGLLRHISSTPSPGPGRYHPFPGLPARPLPPQRPLQDLEGTDFSSFLAVGTPRHSVPWAFLRGHRPSSPDGSGPQCSQRRLSDRPGRVRRVETLFSLRRFQTERSPDTRLRGVTTDPRLFWKHSQSCAMSRVRLSVGGAE